MDTKYVRIEELARATRLPAAWLKREADAGRLPCIRAGRLRHRPATLAPDLSALKISPTQGRT